MSTVLLPAGATLWVPYGWHVASVTMTGASDDNAAATMVQPYICEQFASQCKDMPDIAKHIIDQVAVCMDDQCKTGSKLGPYFIQWLEAVSTCQQSGQRSMLAINGPNPKSAAKRELTRKGQLNCAAAQDRQE